MAIVPVIPTGADGLKTYSSSQVNIIIAPSTSIDDKVDFTSDDLDGIVKFPVSSSVKKNIEEITQKYIGQRTEATYFGQTTIQGTLNDIANPNTIKFYGQACLGGVVQSVANTHSLIAIEGVDSFTIKYEIVKNPTTEEVLSMNWTFTLNDGAEKTLTLLTTSKVSDVVDWINENLIGMGANYITGDGTELIDISLFEDKTVLYDVMAVFRIGKYADTSGLPAYLNLIIPKAGDPYWFNMLQYSSKAPVNTQFIGARLMTLALGFANGGLTTANCDTWVSSDEDFEGTPKPSGVDDVSSVFAQTNGRTKVYSCGVRMTSVKSISNNFAWDLSPEWNVTNEAFELPNEGYQDPYDFECAFNEQSKEIFENRVLNGQNISVIISSTTQKDGKKYDLVKLAKSLLGQPQFPELSEGQLGLSASGMKAQSNVYDPFTSMMIITSDEAMDVTYTVAEMSADFISYDSTLQPTGI